MKKRLRTFEKSKCKQKSAENSDNLYWQKLEKKLKLWKKKKEKTYRLLKRQRNRVQMVALQIVAVLQWEWEWERPNKARGSCRGRGQSEAWPKVRKKCLVSVGKSDWCSWGRAGGRRASNVEFSTAVAELSLSGHCSWAGPIGPAVQNADQCLDYFLTNRLLSFLNSPEISKEIVLFCITKADPMIVAVENKGVYELF